MKHDGSPLGLPCYPHAVQTSAPRIGPTSTILKSATLSSIRCAAATAISLKHSVGHSTSQLKSLFAMAPFAYKWQNAYILTHLPPFRHLHLQLKKSSFSNNQLKSSLLSAAFSYSSRLQKPHPFLFPCCISFILSLVILISLLCSRIHWGHMSSPTPGCKTQ